MVSITVVCWIIIIIIIIWDNPTITAACELLAHTEYVKRHDGLAKIIHQKMAEAAELIDNESPYYKYTPANVLENENFNLYWNRSVLKDKTIPFNRPDITFVNKKTKNDFLMDIAVRNTQNLAKTTTDKQNKYENWRMKYVPCGSKRQHKLSR